MIGKFIILLVAVLVCLGCRENHKDQVLVQIGAYSLTNSDYEYIRNSNIYRGLSEDQLHTKLIEESRMIAYALDHKYDTITTLSKQLEHAKYLYASQVDGYIWNKNVKPSLKVSEEDIQYAFHERHSEYLFEAIHFSSERILRKYWDHERSISKDDFFSIKSMASADPEVKIYNYFTRYPFPLLEVYHHENLLVDVGYVWGPLETMDGYFMLHSVSEKSVSIGSYDSQKESIRNELLNNLKQKIIWESQKRIFRQTQLKMYDNVILDIALKFDPDIKTWPGMEQSLVLMEYFLEDRRYDYTVADFIDYVHSQPVFWGSLSSPEDVKRMLKSFLIGIFLYTEALQMGMESDEEYQLFVKWYQYRIFIGHFKREKIYTKVQVSEEEISNYYQVNSDSNSCFEFADVSIFRFNDQYQAMDSRGLIINQLDSAKSTWSLDNVVLPNEERAVVNINDSLNVLPVIPLLLKMESGQVSMPILVGDQYWIVYLNSTSGTVRTPYSYAREDIRQYLYSQKEQAIHARLAEELEEKYPFQNNLLERHLAKVDKFKELKKK